MIKNYFKTALRNLFRNKSFALINITGLAVGIASCLLIFLVVHFETSFDNYHKKRDHIYRLFTVSKGPQGVTYNSGVPMPTAEGLRLDYPNVITAAVFKADRQITIPADQIHGAKKFEEKDLFFADPQLFDVFDFDWLAGDKKVALTEPNTVVLRQDEAEKYFGDWRDAIGKTIVYDNRLNLKVTGVLKNMPANTDLQLPVVISSATFKNTEFSGGLKDWSGILSYYYCFVVLPDNLTVSQFNHDLDAFVKKYKPADRVNDKIRLIPLSQMHYDSRASVFSGHTFSRELIEALSLVGLFLLIIACVNFVNLATAQAVNRSKEVGVRKVLGGSRSQLIAQFISETFLITVFAVGLATVISGAAVPFLNNLLDIKLSTSFLGDRDILFFLAAIILGVTFLAGFYPAIVVSGFNPITALKNKLMIRQTSGISLRRGLVVFQFCIAQVLVIGTLVIISQMDYFKNHSLGFNKDAVLTVPIPNDSLSLTKLPVVRNQLMQLPGVKDVSFSYATPSDDGNWLMNFKYNNSDKKTDFYASFKWADADYFRLYGIKFIAGHPYDRTDQVKGYVVNETLLKKLGVRDPKDAIGKFINVWNDKTKYAPIVGVVKDFNISSLRDKIPPVVMASWTDSYGTISVKLQPSNLSSSLAGVEKVWNSSFPAYVYSYQFLDDKIAKFYEHDQQLSMLYRLFAGIAIFISCLGLYGLVSFMAVQRNKEVGIRKVLGASVSHIVYLFSKEFTMLVLVAFVAAAPIGWYLMNKWLQGYSYKITLGPGIFLSVIIISITIAWITVGYKAVKAALANPVKSLRSE